MQNKILITESQTKLLFEEIDRNDTIQKMILSDESEFEFDLGKSSLSDLNSASVFVNGKKISKELLEVKYKEETINDETCYILVIIINKRMRNYGIAKKILGSFTKKFGPVAVFYNIVNGKVVQKFVKSLDGDENYSNEDIKNEKGENIGKIIRYSFSSNINMDDFPIEMINESKMLNEGIINKIFYGCRTSEEKKQRLLSLAKRGVFALWVLLSLVAYISSDKVEQEEIKTEIENIVSDNNSKNAVEDNKTIDNTKYASDYTISSEGEEHIKNYEKLSLKPYYATKNERKRGILTIGYGHKITNKDPEWLKNENGITQEQAEELFKQDIKISEKYIKIAIEKLPNREMRTPNIYPQILMDVMISMMFNGGYGNFINLNSEENLFYTTLKKCRIDKTTGKIRKDDYDFTISKIPKSIIRQGGNEIPGLVNRRNTEYSSLLR